MKIEAYKRYTVLCRKINGIQNIIYQWDLIVEPHHKAWRILGENISVGQVFKGHLILSIEEVEHKMIQYKKDYPYENDYAWTRPINEDEFNFSVLQSNIGFAVAPIYEASYRCQLCGGVVANDICTACMFDWDN